MAAEQANEQEIQFRKRARRRLVGAIALVLLMVTILPMLLDDRSEKTPQQEITITIPSQEETDFASKIVPVMPEVLPQSTSEPGSNAADELAEQEAEVALEPEPAAPASAAKTPATKAVEKPMAEKKPVQSDEQAYVVQIGVFSTMASIEQLQRKLLAQGYKSYTEKLVTDKGNKIRLRAGPFASRAEAENAMTKIKDAGMAAIVITE